MERDSRRHQGEWRGLHNFDKVICDGDSPAAPERRGGLKMGQRYYYYYEVDGSTETYNPALPTTTACPFLPGQTVNTLDVPSERGTRMKSASMNSLRNTDYKTMEPADRVAAPRVQSSAGARREFRLPSASVLSKRSTRSVSPGPSWTGTARRFLGFKSHHRDKEGDRGRKASKKEREVVLCEEEPEEATESRCVTPSGSVKSRELSPESLRRFLSDERPSSSSNAESAHTPSIIDDIVEEAEDDDDEDDDDNDDNFATASIVENNSFTNLSPPPFQRGGLSAPPARHTNAVTIPQPMALVQIVAKRPMVAPMKLDIPRSHSTLSTASSSLASATSPLSNISQGHSQFSFFDDSEDDEDLASHPGDETLRDGAQQEAPITGYSLPRASPDNKTSIDSPSLVGRNGNGVPVDSNFFGLPNVDIGLEDLVGDGNWMNEVIRQK